MTGGFGPPCVGTWERCAPVGGARPCQEDWRRHSRPPVTGRASPPPLPRPPPQGVLERAAHGSRRGVEGPGPYEDGTLGLYFNIRYRAGPGRAGLVYTQWRWRARMHRAPPSAPSGGYCPMCGRAVCDNPPPPPPRVLLAAARSAGGAHSAAAAAPAASAAPAAAASAAPHPQGQDHEPGGEQTREQETPKIRE